MKTSFIMALAVSVLIGCKQTRVLQAFEKFKGFEILDKGGFTKFLARDSIDTVSIKLNSQDKVVWTKKEGSKLSKAATVSLRLMDLETARSKASCSSGEFWCRWGNTGANCGISTVVEAYRCPAGCELDKSKGCVN